MENETNAKAENRSLPEQMACVSVLCWFVDSE